MNPYAAEKERNRKLNAQDIAQKRETFASNPTQLIVEPTNRCNAACPICARHFWDEQANPPTDLNETTLAKLEPFFRTADTVFAFGHGEPLIAPVFWRLLETARRYGCRVELTTNGLALDEPAIDRLIELGVAIINISMDAVEPGALHGRRGLDVAAAEKIFAYLNRAKYERGATEPEGGIAVVADRENLAELPHLLQFAADLNVRTLLVNHLVAWDESLHTLSAYHEPQRLRDAFAALRQQGEQAGVAVVLPYEMIEDGRCPHPLHMFAVRAGGEVWPCCNAVFRNERYSFPAGNVHQSDLRDIWNGATYRLLRRAFLQGDPLLAHCRICPLFSDELASHLRNLRPEKT